MPGRKNGCGPGPAPASTVPTCDAAGQAPVAAPGVHSGTLAIFASRPGGSVTLSPESSWSVSLRESDSANGVNAPASVLVDPAVNEGENPVTQPALIENESVGEAAAAPFQGVRADVAVNDPQLSGVATAARAPPKKSSLKSLNGSCGLLSNVVTSCPLAGLGTTWPASLTSTPSDSAAT